MNTLEQAVVNAMKKSNLQHSVADGVLSVSLEDKYVTDPKDPQKRMLAFTGGQTARHISDLNDIAGWLTRNQVNADVYGEYDKLVAEKKAAEVEDEKEQVNDELADEPKNKGGRPKKVTEATE
jgi:hypothetical protein